MLGGWRCRRHVLILSIPVDLGENEGVIGEEAFPLSISKSKYPCPQVLKLVLPTRISHHAPIPAPIPVPVPAPAPAPVLVLVLVLVLVPGASSVFNRKEDSKLQKLLFQTLGSSFILGKSQGVISMGRRCWIKMKHETLFPDFF